MQLERTEEDEADGLINVLYTGGRAHVVTLLTEQYDAEDDYCHKTRPAHAGRHAGHAAPRQICLDLTLGLHFRRHIQRHYPEPALTRITVTLNLNCYTNSDLTTSP